MYPLAKPVTGKISSGEVVAVANYNENGLNSMSSEFRYGNVFVFASQFLQAEFLRIMTVLILFVTLPLALIEFFVPASIQYAGPAGIGPIIFQIIVPEIVTLTALAIICLLAKAFYDGRPETAVRALSLSLPLLPGMIVMTLIKLVATSLGFFALIIPGIILTTMFCVATPVFVLERAGILGSLGRSAELTSGHRWRVLLIFIIAFIATAVILVVPELIWSALAINNMNYTNSIQFTMLYNLADTLETAIFGVLFIGVYFELKRLIEGPAQSRTVDVFD